MSDAADGNGWQLSPLFATGLEKMHEKSGWRTAAPAPDDAQVLQANVTVPYDVQQLDVAPGICRGTKLERCLTAAGGWSATTPWPPAGPRQVAYSMYIPRSHFLTT